MSIPWPGQCRRDAAPACIWFLRAPSRGETERPKLPVPARLCLFHRACLPESQVRQRQRCRQEHAGPGCMTLPIAGSGAAGSVAPAIFHCSSASGGAEDRTGLQRHTPGASLAGLPR